MKRADILSAIAQRLETIQKENGYLTDIGKKVLYWQDFPSEYEADLTIYKDTNHRFERKNQIFQHELDIEIQGILFSGQNTSEVVQDFLAAIGEDETWGKLTAYTNVKAADTQLVSTGKRAMSVTLFIEVSYRSELWSV